MYIVHAASDIGRSRKKNEDSYFLDPPPEGKEAGHGRLFLVADGMGGHAAGDVASRKAVACVSENYYASDLEDGENPTQRLRQAFRHGSESILRDASRNIEHFGMGTTCSGVVLRGERFWFCHVGDSRIYRFHDGRLVCLSRDHTLLARMLESGKVTADEPLCVKLRHVLTYAMGKDDHVELDFSEKPTPFLADDKIMICSDGLHSVVKEERITEILASGRGQEAVDALIAEALGEGGPDNITVLLVERA